MFKDLLKKIFGDKYSKIIKELEPVVVEINEHYNTLQVLSDFELKEKTKKFKEQINEHTAELRQQMEAIKTQLQSNDEVDVHALHDERDALQEKIDESYEEILDEILPEAFAVVKETCRRLTGKSWTVMGHKLGWEMVPYDVQLMGGIVLHQGKIAEMATGEGKTLVATLPLYLNGLTGRGVHLVTVNDYLAQRDSEWMGEIFRFHDLSVGVILTNMDPDKRKKQYDSDIIYGTNNEFGFDYLRDNMAIDAEHQVQREYFYAIVDEVDSVLIDEARTPLIISGPTEIEDQKFDELKPRIEKLYRLQTNLVAKLLQEADDILSNAAGKEKSGKDGYELVENERKEILSRSAQKEQTFEAGKMLLRAQRGLPKNRRLAKLVADPHYKQLLQDTEMEFLREKGKNMHIIDEELYFVIDEKNHTIELTEIGREELSKGTREDKSYFVLTDIGTEVSKFENDSTLSDAEKNSKKDKLYHDYSERSDRLHTLNQLLKAYTLFEKDVEYVITEEGKVAIVDEFTGRVLPGRRYSDGLHQAIEAKENVKVERDTQTLATITLQNYFRMYHKLAGMTGTAETEEAELFDIYKLEVVVVPTNKKVCRDDQDDKIYRSKREKYNAIAEKVQSLREEGRPVLVGTTSVEVSETLSRMLKRKNVPHNVLNAKQHKSEAEIVTNAGESGSVTIATNMAGRGTDIKLGAGVVAKGGLFILGTERHESRRIDRQLRGRAGRQGDPGSTTFFLSLEDDLMRLFGSQRMASVMERLGLKEGDVIEHSLITKSVERAQKKVEENNFSIRKRLLEYDDTMNQQRTIIYSRRNRALKGERLKGELFELLEELIDDMVERRFENAEMEEMREELRMNFLTDMPISPVELEKYGKDGLKDYIMSGLKAFYQNKEEMLGADMMARIERYSFLSVIDHKWKEHLREMDDMKEGIHLRAYGQKDPLIEYKGEAYKMFVELLDKIKMDTVTFCFKFFPQAPEEVDETRRKNTNRRMVTQKQSTEGIGLSGSSNEEGKAPIVKQETVRVTETIGRNDLCYCGSGKKYKKCHGV